jgi:3-methyladenine DNA glycosylase Tag
MTEPFRGTIAAFPNHLAIVAKAAPFSSCVKRRDIRGFSWLTQTKKWEGFEEKRRAFRMEMVGRPSAFFV